jgi:hypothetical protein
MIGSLRFSAATMLVLVLLASHATAQCVSPTGLNGGWKANDGGTYYLRRLDSVVWWMGMSAEGGRSWTNVFRGTTNGDTITGEWADVIGKGAGTMTLKILGKLGVGVHGFDKIGGTGSGFGGQHWFRPCNDTN